MTDGIQEIIEESKRNRHSQIWNHLLEADVISIWENVARFIEKNLLQQKGVSIPGLGTFAFSQTKLDVGNNKYLLLQRPVFVLLERFALTHGLQHRKHLVPGSIPVIPLNMSQLSFDGPFDRDTVESCVRDIVGALGRSVAAGRRVDLTFSGVGRLRVHGSKVKMKFYKTFVNSVDGSGQLLESLQGRPGTADSVMSERCVSRMSRPGTNAGFRRKLEEFSEEDDDFTRRSGQQLPAIDEEEEDLDVDQDDELSPCEDFHQTGSEVDGKEFDLQTDDLPEKSVVRCVTLPSAGHRVALAMPRATAMSFTDDRETIETTQKDDRRRSASDRQRPATSPPFHARQPGLTTQGDRDDSPISPGFRASRLSPGDSGFFLLLQDKAPSPPASASSSCGHANSGQELCYLCHQRARRNVAVSFAEERRRKEAEEDEALRQFQEVKAAAEDLKDKKLLLLRRQENEKVTAFNLGIAEANAHRKQMKEKFTPSFVFQRRLLTPPQFIIRGRYQKELESQIAAKDAFETKQKMEEAFLGRLEQAHLADELASQKAERLKKKFDQREEYRRALSAQLKMKPEPIPGSLPPSGEPYFGKNDTDEEKTAEKRRRANELFCERVALVEQRKREEILKRLEEQRKEEDTLRRVQQECASDAAGRYDALLRNRRSLESDWIKAAAAKRQRDLDQRLHDRAGAKLVHEQCDAYKRCGRCKRRVDNLGETNVWCETRYQPGARIIV